MPSPGGQQPPILEVPASFGVGPSGTGAVVDVRLRGRGLLLAPSLPVC